MTNTVSAGKDDFYRQMFRLTIPIIIQNLLSAAVNFRRRNYAQLRRTVCNFRSVPGCQLLQYPVYGILRTWHRRISSVRTIFW